MVSISWPADVFVLVYDKPCVLECRWEEKGSGGGGVAAGQVINRIYDHSSSVMIFQVSWQ